MKKINFTLAILGIAAIGAFGLHKQTISDIENDITIANISALCDPEGTIEIEWHAACLGPGDGCCLKGGYWWEYLLGVF